MRLLCLEFKRHPKSGLSLFEALISLTVVSLVLGISAARLRDPARLQYQRLQAETIAAAQLAQLEAINDGRSVVFSVPRYEGCELNEQSVVFYPDGTALGGSICIGGTAKLTVNPITGRIDRDSE